MIVWRWLNNIPLNDPIEQKLAPLLQLVLIAILVIAPINFMIDITQGGVPPDVGGGVLFLLICLALLILLRKGYFQVTAGILLVVLILGNNTRLMRASAADADEALLTFFLPITIAGVLARRRLLVAVFAISCLLILSPSHRDKLGISTLSLFIINAGLICFLLDLFGRTLYAELKQAANRNEALGKAHQALEISSSALYELSERLTVTLKSIGDAVIVTDTQGRVTLLNTLAEQLTGWSQADAEGQPLNTVFRIINEHSRETVESPVDKVMREGTTVGLANHTLLLSRDGREIHIDDSGAPIIDKHGAITGVVLVFRDISERRQAEVELQQHIRDIAALEERHRLSRDLHDAVSQMLFSSSIIAESLTRMKKDPEMLQVNLERLHRLNRGASAEMRKLLMELRSPELMDIHMPELLKQLADAAMGNTAINVTVSVTETDALPKEIQIAFFRIAQEALNNIVKHAGASQARISFHSTAHAASLSVEDDGRGFDVQAAAQGIGLHTMRERAEALGATFDVKSQVGQGTQIMIQWKHASQE